MFICRYSDSSFGEEAESGCKEHSWLIVCSLDGTYDLDRIASMIRFLGLAEKPEDEGIPLMPTSRCDELHLGDEAWFPNMSVVAFFDEKPVAVKPLPAAYLAFADFANPLSRRPSIITAEEAESWMLELGIQKLVAWSDQVLIVTPGSR